MIMLLIMHSLINLMNIKDIMNNYLKKRGEQEIKSPHTVSLASVYKYMKPDHRWSLLKQVYKQDALHNETFIQILYH